MLKIQEIRELIKLVNQSELDEFVYEFKDGKIKMKKNGHQVIHVQKEPIVEQVNGSAVVEQKVEPIVQSPTPQPEKVEKLPVEAQEKEIKEELHKITSPMVGTFYQAPAPDADPYVKVGSKVTKDTIVCIVEAMKLFNEIEAEVNGEIVEVLVKDGQLVEYGQPLFLVRPE